MSDKICPIMAAGWISNHQNLKGRAIYWANDPKEHLPKCLKEKCALWRTTVGKAGLEHYCGLRGT